MEIHSYHKIVQIKKSIFFRDFLENQDSFHKYYSKMQWTKKAYFSTVHTTHSAAYVWFEIFMIMISLECILRLLKWKFFSLFYHWNSFMWYMLVTNITKYTFTCDTFLVKLNRFSMYIHFNNFVNLSTDSYCCFVCATDYTMKWEGFLIEFKT